MTSLLMISGPASVLLLLAALLAAGARADYVTTAECKAINAWRGRVRQYPVDSDGTTLNMEICSLTAIQEQALSGLPAVTWVRLSWNKLRELPVFGDHTCHNLTWLNVDENQLTSINSETFSACINLEALNLSNNQIEFIDTSVFNTLTNLHYLYLTNNKIRFIPDQMFSNNGKLKRLTLDGNRITHIPPDFASRLKRAGASLDEFYIDSNPWHCACLIELLVDVRRAGVIYYYNHYVKKRPYTGTAPVCVYSGAAPCCRRAPTGLVRGGLA